MKVGIIGYGSMGKMLLHRFSDSGLLDSSSLFVSTRTRSKLDEVSGIATACTNCEAAANSDILFLCLRPTEMKGIMEEIKSSLRPETLFVSLNGSITFDMLAKTIDQKTAKVIPSLTAEINRSQTLVCYNDKVNDSDKKALTTLLETIGNVIELPENELGMGSELVSCMPGFIASVFDVICESAKAHTSIPYDQVVKMVLNTMSATGDLMLQKELSFNDVVTRVATKGGITEVGSSVIYEGFPKVADDMFEKTLEKRRQTAIKAGESFGD